MTSNGTRGADFERRVRRELEQAGYTVVRSAASKTGVDLVAFGDAETGRFGGANLVRWDDAGMSYFAGETLAVQNKIDCCEHFGPDAWNDLYDLATGAGSVPVLAWLDRSARKHRVRYWRITGPCESRKPRPHREVTLEVTDA